MNNLSNTSQNNSPLLSIPDKKIYIFDLDGTLAESKAALTDTMSHILIKLMEHKEMAVISGGNFAQFSSQVIDRLQAHAPDILKKIYIFPASGGQMYHYNGEKWKEIYNVSLSVEDKQKIQHAFDVVLPSVPFSQAIKLYGPQIEDRDSQITFSALGQHAPVDEKKLWDPDLSKKHFLIDALQPLLPDFAVHMGGLTSIDVLKNGIDKAYGIEKLSEYTGVPVHDMCYIGDALYEGGNDEAVKKTGIECVQVKDMKDTATKLVSLLGM